MAHNGEEGVMVESGVEAGGQGGFAVAEAQKKRTGERGRP